MVCVIDCFAVRPARGICTDVIPAAVVILTRALIPPRLALRIHLTILTPR